MSGSPKNSSAFGAEDEKAEALFDANGSKDPFPNIAPALLNSADIHDYIEKTGMVCPYRPEVPGKLKSSSLELDIGDLVIYWDEKGEHCEKTLEKGDSFSLEPNSLVFIKTAQKFRIPSYMAIRFNLKITNVHRGLLLGTGPLVDPGFQGHLLIPVHNLTKNPYTFTAGKGFIWVEFTKISPNSEWDSTKTYLKDLIGKYQPFPKDKFTEDVRDYLKKASPHKSIQNAIPDKLREVRKIADEASIKALAAQEKAINAEKHSEAMKTNISKIGGWSAVAIVVSLVAILLSVWQTYTGFREVINQSNDIMLSLRNEYNLPQRSDEIITSIKETHSDSQKLLQELDRIKLSNIDKEALIDQREKILKLEKLIREQMNKINQLLGENTKLKIPPQQTSGS